MTKHDPLGALGAHLCTSTCLQHVDPHRNLARLAYESTDGVPAKLPGEAAFGVHLLNRATQIKSYGV
jgi:hypothetical protein